MSRSPNPQLALKGAVTSVGSQTAFAELCGVSQTAVWKWLDRGKHLPAEHVLKVEAATGISRHDLRPDLYPVEPVTSPGGASEPRPCHVAVPVSTDGGASVSHADHPTPDDDQRTCDRSVTLQCGEAVG